MKNTVTVILLSVIFNIFLIEASEKQNHNPNDPKKINKIKVLEEQAISHFENYKKTKHQNDLNKAVDTLNQIEHKMGKIDLLVRDEHNNLGRSEPAQRVRMIYFNLIKLKNGFQENNSTYNAHLAIAKTAIKGLNVYLSYET